MGAAVFAIVAIGLEQVPPAVSVNVTARSSELQRRRSSQPFALEMPEASAEPCDSSRAIVKVAFGYAAKCADRRQHATFAAVHLIDALAMKDQSGARGCAVDRDPS